MSSRCRFVAVFALACLSTGCAFLIYETPVESIVSTYGFSFDRSRPAAGDVTFSVALPRDGYLDVKWAYTYLAIDAVPSSSGVVFDEQGNSRFEFTVASADFARLDHLFFSETVEGVLPLFSFHEQEFPASFGASFAPYLVSNPDIPADDPLVTAIATRLRRDSMIETIARAVGFFDTFDYDYHFYGSAPAAGEHEAPYAGEDSLYRETLAVLDDLAGVCYEKARLGAAILRACGIPTRIVLTSGHSWNEVYLPQDGWVPLCFSSPEREKSFTFPIQPWRVDDFANTTAIGGSGEPPHLLDWDTTLWGYLSYQGSDSVSASGDSVTDAVENPGSFFSTLRFIVATPLMDTESSAHPLRFFAPDTTGFVFERGTELVLELNDDTDVTLDLVNPMTFDVGGVSMTFRCSRVGAYLVIERL